MLCTCTGGACSLKVWDKCASLQRIIGHDIPIPIIFSLSAQSWDFSPAVEGTKPPGNHVTPFGISATVRFLRAAQHRGARQDRARPRHEMLGELNASLTILPDSVRFGEEKFTCSGAQAG